MMMAATGAYSVNYIPVANRSGRLDRNVNHTESNDDCTTAFFHFMLTWQLQVTNNRFISIVE
jgi:hypothetical protein